MMDCRYITIISFTREGTTLNALLNQGLARLGYSCDSITPARYAQMPGMSGMPSDLKSEIGKNWGYSSFVFIGAAGIAIRYTAPFLKDKYTDSAVLSLDEKGAYIIPLIAGHVGGGVELARIIGKITGGIPVITTATDVQGKFAVDVFAKSHQLEIGNRDLAKEISASLLNGNYIGLYSEIELHEQLPEEVIQVDCGEDLMNYPYGVYLVAESGKNICNFPTDDQDKRSSILYLTPSPADKDTSSKNIIVGMGCRKGVSKEHILKQLVALLSEHRLTIADIKLIASIDIKKFETGILFLTKEYEIPFVTFTAAELKRIVEVSSRSLFVEETIGVDNVCERAAKLAAPNGTLIQPKICMDGVTFSLVKEQPKIPRILVFAGTTEGRIILEYLKEYQVAVIACVATEYGKSSLENIIMGNASNIEVRTGRLLESEMSQLIQTECVELVIDATHPFAGVVTQNIRKACEAAGTEYLRLLRGADNGNKEGDDINGQDNIIWKDTVKEAVDYLMETTGNIFISTGSKELKEYTRLADYKERCYARVLSAKQSVDDSTALGFEGKHLIAMQGPFSKKMNVATLEQTDAAYFVTKETGLAGGFVEKLYAAREKGVQLIVIGRPKETGMTMESVCELLKGRYTC